MNEWQRLIRLAESQHGVFSLTQATQLGLSPRAVQERVHREGWDRSHNGVFRLPGASSTYEQAAMAALLAVRPGRATGERGVLVAARSAARLWEMTQARQRPVQLITPFGQPATEREPLYVIRSRTLLPSDATSVGPIDLTTPERTIIDLGRYAGRGELLDTASTGVRLGVLSEDRLAARLAEMLRPPGKPNLHWLLAELAHHGRTDSTFEREAREWLLANGFHPYPGVYPLRIDGRLIAMLDIAFPPDRVYVECDGRRYHSDRRAFHHDRVRDNEIASAAPDWLGLRLTKDEYEQAPRRFLRQLTTTLWTRRGQCAV